MSFVPPSAFLDPTEDDGFISIKGHARGEYVSLEREFVIYDGDKIYDYAAGYLEAIRLARNAEQGHILLKLASNFRRVITDPHITRPGCSYRYIAMSGLDEIDVYYTFTAAKKFAQTLDEGWVKIYEMYTVIHEPIWLPHSFPENNT